MNCEEVHTDFDILTNLGVFSVVKRTRAKEIVKNRILYALLIKDLFMLDCWFLKRISN